MKGIVRTYRKLHIWLSVNLALLAAFFLLRSNRALMNALSNTVTSPLRRALGRLSYLTEISVMEVLCALAVLAGIGYAVWSILAVVRAKNRGRRLYGVVLGAGNIALSVYVLFCLLWGTAFWTDSFQERSGIYAQGVAREDLQAVTAYFAAQLERTADAVPRDEAGIFAVPREEILEKAPTVYDPLEREMPFLAFDDPGVKAMRFSRLMSVIGFTGVYCSYTGESNVNVDSPACLLPSTVAHELAHQRGIASEQECNFLAVLASTCSEEAAYAYSGWLMGYIHLGNALYSVDPEALTEIRDALPETVLKDLRYNNAYWAQFQDKLAQKVSEKVYDGMLKAYGEENGIRSYGTVVDLLVAYYRSDALS